MPRTEKRCCAACGRDTRHFSGLCVHCHDPDDRLVTRVPMEDLLAREDADDPVLDEGYHGEGGGDL